MTCTVRLIISGRVQGVGYREFVRAEAEKRDLDGWVRNRRDGTVEALVAGAPEQVEEIIAACWRGPPASRVAGVASAETLEPTSATGFAVLPTT
jgi:acylphosphatase